MLNRQGGSEALLGLLRRWSAEDRWDEVGSGAGALIAALPDARRRAVCLSLLSFAKNAPPEERIKMSSAASLAAGALSGGWLPGEDDALLLDAFLSLPPVEERKVDYVAEGISSALCKRGVDCRPFLAQVVEAHLNGCSGPWKKQTQLVESLLSEAPSEVVRPLAQEALQSEDQKRLCWGISQLIGRLNDPANDGAPFVLLGRFLEDPRFRPVIFRDYQLSHQALPPMRRMLREGRLTLPEAASAMSDIKDLYGGFLHSPEDDFVTQSGPEEQERLRERFREFLCPEELCGPPTEEEWRRYREKRDERPIEDYRQMASTLLLYPPGPFGPEDRAFVDRVMEDWRSGRIPAHLNFFLIGLLAVRATKEADVLVLEEVIAGDAQWQRNNPGRFDPVDVEICLRGPEDLRRKVRKRLGLPLPSGPLGPARDEWMDEPEEPEEEV